MEEYEANYQIQLASCSVDGRYVIAITFKDDHENRASGDS